MNDTANAGGATMTQWMTRLFAGPAKQPASSLLVARPGPARQPFLLERYSEPSIGTCTTEPETKIESRGDVFRVEMAIVDDQPAKQQHSYGVFLEAERGNLKGEKNGRKQDTHTSE